VRFVRRFGALNVGDDGLPQRAYSLVRPMCEPARVYRQYARLAVAAVRLG
jgi:hypothetical protein